CPQELNGCAGGIWQQPRAGVTGQWVPRWALKMILFTLLILLAYKARLMRLKKYWCQTQKWMVFCNQFLKTRAQQVGLRRHIYQSACKAQSLSFPPRAVTRPRELRLLHHK